MPKKLDRRALFRRFVPEATEHVGDVIRKHAPRRELPLRRRPPGAVNEADFLDRCELCPHCIEACPFNAVHTLPSGVLGAGTPVMVPESRACHMCEGFPCAAACPTGALEVPTTRAWKLGAVSVDEQRCLPYRGPECGACRDRCPSGVDALHFMLTRPIVDGDACVGCGICIEVCVVDPPAIQMVPLESGAAMGIGDDEGSISES